MKTQRSTPAAAGQEGMTLVEAMITLFLLAMVLLSIAQMIGFGLNVHRISGDVTSATVLAEARMEQLRNTDYDLLAPGGSVDNDIAGFFDTQDVDNDGNMDFTRRWQVVDNVGSKTITVRVLSPLAVIGTAKEASVMMLVAEPR